MRTPVSSVPTCADMGPLLRGPIDDEDVEGPKKEALIIASCERDHWPPAVLACAASATEPTVQACLDQLSPALRASYDKALETYGASAEDADGDRAGADAVADTTCPEALAATSVDAWPPFVTVEAERSLAWRLRGAALRASCESERWSAEVRSCIATTPASGITACIDQLGDAGRKQVDETIAQADGLRMRIVKAKARPANVTCPKVVAAHYGTARWTGQAPALTGSNRTKAIAASRTAMLAACKEWTIDARACIVSDDRDECYVLAGVPASRWGFPAAITTSNMKLTGIAECDEYALAVEALQTCASLSVATRDAMKDAYDEAIEEWSGLTGEALEAARAACKVSADATRQAAAGCTSRAIR